MIERTTRPLPRRVLMVDDELAQPATAGGRAVRALAEELRARGIEVDRGALLRGRHGDRGLRFRHPLRLRQLDPGQERPPVARPGHRAAPGAPGPQRQGPGLPDGRSEGRGHGHHRGGHPGRRVRLDPRGHRRLRGRAGGRRRSSATSRACCRRSPRRWPATTGSGSTPGRRPGHQGGVAFLKSPIGRVFFDFYGENLFRTDMGIERAALGSLLGHTGPIGESERYAARVFGAHRSYSVLNGTSGSNRAIMSACVGDGEIALCDRNCHKSIEQGLVAHRRDSGVPEPHPQPLRHHRADSAGTARARGDRQEHRRATRWPRAPPPSARSTPWSPTAPTTGCATTPPTPRRGWPRAWTGSTSTRRGTATRGSIRCTATATRCAGDPADHPKDGPDGLRHPLDPQAAGGALADLLHPHPGRPGRHRPRPVQRGLLHAGQHLAALRADRLERRGGGDDGRAGRADPDPGRDRRGGGLPAGGGAHPAGIRGQEGLVLRALERRGGQGPQDRQEDPLPRGAGRAAGHRAQLLGAASGRELARLRRHPRQLVHARPDQVRHRVPRDEAGWGARRQGHSGRHRHRLPGPPRDRPVAHHRPHGAVPLLGGDHQGQVGDAAQHAARLQGRLRPQRAAGRGAARRGGGRRPRATPAWASRTWATRCGPT